MTTQSPQNLKKDYLGSSVDTQTPPTKPDSVEVDNGRKNSRADGATPSSFDQEGQTGETQDLPFNLSEKINNDVSRGEIIYIEDVKEFIQLLKEMCIRKMHSRRDMEFVLDQITLLAGRELT